MGNEANSNFSLKDELEKTYVENNTLFAVTFELTYTCNLSCKHCYIVDNPAKELHFDKVKDIIDQLVDMGTFYITYTGGEVFTHNDFLDILAYAKKKRFFQVILTNGTLITNKIADFLKEIQPVGVEISLLGATSATHDSITGVEGSFKEAIKAIDLLVKRDIKVITKTTLMKLNVHEYSEIKVLSAELGASPKISPGVLPMIDSSTQPLKYEISWEDREKYLNNDILDDNFLSNIEDNKHFLTCKAGKVYASVNPYGDVYPCILLPIKIGNLWDNSFSEIWNNKGNNTLKELRNLTSSDLKECSNCDYVSFCGRCTGAAYLESGSIRAPCRSACQNAKWKAYQLSGNKKREIY